jgi:primary-amine oxidase
VLLKRAVWWNVVTGKPVAYKLVPASNLTLLATPSSMIAQRGGFAEKNLWVTPHSDDERFPSSAQLTVS